MIKVKRIYDAPERGDGKRFLVDRLWPRGVKKDKAELAGWLREVAPSAALRKWFGHDAAKWAEFQTRYFKELRADPESWQPLVREAQAGTVTLLFGARDEEHNNAVALRSFLEKKAKR